MAVEDLEILPTEAGYKWRFAVMGSTRGSSLVPILEAWRRGELGSEPVVVLSDREKAGILEKAREAGVPEVWLSAKGMDREQYDRRCDEVLHLHGVEFILLIGYMRILSPWFVRAWRGRIVNVHPSLLPRHGGLMDLQVHEAVLASGDAESGCTVHLVTEAVDGGPVLLQKHCEVRAGVDALRLKAQVQALEGQAFVELLHQPQVYLGLENR
jgi:formyltetrahydrofolate-dependent phosphoribosylglycinamide formyltransferase